MGTQHLRDMYEYGADWCYDKAAGVTLLMSAASEADSNAIEELLKHGASVNLKDADGNTALHYLSHSGLDYTHSLEILIRNGADIGARNRLGQDFLECIPDAYKKHRMSEALAAVFPKEFNRMEEKLLKLTPDFLVTVASLLKMDMQPIQRHQLADKLMARAQEKWGRQYY